MRHDGDHSHQAQPMNQTRGEQGPKSKNTTMKDPRSCRTKTTGASKRGFHTWRIRAAGARAAPGVQRSRVARDQQRSEEGGRSGGGSERAAEGGWCQSVQGCVGQISREGQPLLSVRNTGAERRCSPSSQRSKREAGMHDDFAPGETCCAVVVGAAKWEAGACGALYGR